MRRLDEILGTVSRAFPEAGIDVLLIGGFAVNHYGYSRTTLDVDFMVVADQVSEAVRLFREAGFTNIDRQESAVFLSHPDGGPRVDLLPVDEETMTRLARGANEAVVHGVRLRIPALRDLLAMKIFAFSRNPARRMGKDLPDIAFLSVLHGLDPEADLGPLCERFGTPEAFAMIQQQIRGIRTP